MTTDEKAKFKELVHAANALFLAKMITREEYIRIRSVVRVKRYERENAGKKLDL